MKYLANFEKQNNNVIRNSLIGAGVVGTGLATGAALLRGGKGSRIVGDIVDNARVKQTPRRPSTTRPVSPSSNNVQEQVIPQRYDETPSSNIWRNGDQSSINLYDDIPEPSVVPSSSGRTLTPITREELSKKQELIKQRQTYAQQKLQTEQLQKQQRINKRQRKSHINNSVLDSTFDTPPSLPYGRGSTQSGKDALSRRQSQLQQMPEYRDFVNFRKRRDGKFRTKGNDLLKNRNSEKDIRLKKRFQEALKRKRAEQSYFNNYHIKNIRNF